MKPTGILIVLTLVILLPNGFAQKGDRKSQRQKTEIQKEHLVDSLLNSGTFDFTATRALPQGYGSVDLTTNSNFLRFTREKIKCYMPFFGRAFSIGYGGEGGIKFEGTPTAYTITPDKKGKGYVINATVPVDQDSYKLTLFIGKSGSTTLIINSNQRNTISYYGDIHESEVSKNE